MRPGPDGGVVAVIAAGLLLASAAVAAPGDDPAPPPPPPPPPPAGKASSMHTVKVFATVEDKSAKVDEHAQVMIQSETSSVKDVASSGTKMSVPATRPSTLTLLTPGSRCNVTFDPAKLKATDVMVRMKKTDDGIDCSIAAKVDAAK